MDGRIMEHYLDIESVCIYLLLFGMAITLVFFAECNLFYSDGTLRKGGRKVIAILLLGIAISILCAFAAVRGFHVGLDVTTYITNNYDYALNTNVSFDQYYASMPIKTEVLFAVLIYVCAKVGSIQLLLFLIELLVLVPLTIAMVKEREEGSLVLGFALYLFLFFNFTLSGMRQSIAMSFLVLAYSLFNEKKRAKALALTTVAFFFHSSVVLIFTILFFCYLIVKLRRRAVWYLSIIILLLILIAGFSVFADKLALIAAAVNPRYAYFINRYLHSGFRVTDVPATDIIFKTLLVVIPTLIMCIKHKTSAKDRFLFATSWLGRYFVLFNGVFYESMRIAYYFDYYSIFYSSKMFGLLNSTKDKLIYVTILMACALFYWLYFIMYIGGYGTNVIDFSIHI